MLALLDLPSKLPRPLWFDQDEAAHEKGFLTRLSAALRIGVLLVVYRGLYHSGGTYHRAEASDPVACLAARPDLGPVKRRRKACERPLLTPATPVSVVTDGV